MKVYQIVPRGYCKGVIRAIETAKKQAHHEDTYILGMIVHNQYIVDALENLGIKTIDKKGASREEFEEAAIEISKQIIEMGKGIGAGFYFMTPFNRVSLVKSILEYV